MSTVIEEMAFPLPEEVPEAFNVIIDMCVKSLQDAEEIEVVDWAKKIKDDLSSNEVMTAFEEGFDLSCRAIIEEFERGSESEVPLVISQVVSEMSWLKKRIQARPEDINNNLGLSEIALDSWKDLCEGHPAAKIAVSTIRELVQVAKLLSGGKGIAAEGNNGYVNLPAARRVVSSGTF
ncbi:hypothetical protein [Lysobacter brunescens]|uniref:Uncharacterized protein n=1 Tax=Lysobacter brunescens TaxID=262323 RepID=A0ABW2YGT2_9GAMM